MLVHEAKLHKLWAFIGCGAQGAAAIGNVDADAEGRTPTAYPCADDFVTDFLEAAFCARWRGCWRYRGHEAAGGMQLACPPTLFDALRADLGVTSEIFAAAQLPLRAARRLRLLLPAPDVDAVFGSRGSFFHCSPLSGAFVANPPLILSSWPRWPGAWSICSTPPTRARDALTLPLWSPTGRCLEVRISPRGSYYTTRHTRGALVLPKGSHSYCEQMDGKPTPSRHATSVMVLQSRRAARESPATEAVQGRLRAAFANPNRAHPRNTSKSVGPAPPCLQMLRYTFAVSLCFVSEGF